MIDDSVRIPLTQEQEHLESRAFYVPEPLPMLIPPELLDPCDAAFNGQGSVPTLIPHEPSFVRS